MIANEGLLSLLRSLIGTTALNCRIHLFRNDFEPDETTVLTDLLEATFTGYASKLLMSQGMPIPAINGAGQGESLSPTLTWICTATPSSPETIFGLYITFLDAEEETMLFFAHRFPLEHIISDAGDKVEKKLKLLDAEIAV